MPAKNRASLIPTSIDSIITQSFIDWELIIIDDHSTDNTKKVINQINDRKIKYFFLTRGTGPAVARDYGIKKAQGQIMVLADSDDISKPDRLVLTYSFLKNNPDIDIVYGNLEISENNRIRILKSCPFNHELLRHYNFIFNTTIAFKKDIYIKSTGYDPNLRTSEDYDLWLSFLEIGGKFGYIDKILAQYKVHPESLTKSTQYNQRRKNLAYVRKKHHLPVPNLEETKKIIPKHIWANIHRGRGLEFWFNARI